MLAATLSGPSAGKSSPTSTRRSTGTIIRRSGLPILGEPVLSMEVESERQAPGAGVVVLADDRSNVGIEGVGQHALVGKIENLECYMKVLVSRVVRDAGVGDRVRLLNFEGRGHRGRIDRRIGIGPAPVGDVSVDRQI